jgi:Asp-tRNA(Asn)/Glu-tRNA(Gln) amidotransferase A subunit family amidase
VALLRHAGAVLLGKTVTAELALYSPGPTANPHRISHTPGGSSSGSAAAVACGMADVALGTQTAGSVIRPAAFCGVFGFKPSFGEVTTAGVKLVAPSLDTVGWFARTVADLDAVRVVLTGRRPLTPAARPPRIAVVETDVWPDADDDSRGAVSGAAARAAAAGAEVTRRRAGRELDGLSGRFPAVMAYEAARSLAWEHRACRDRLTPRALTVLDAGAEVDPADYDSVQARVAWARTRLDDLIFGDAEVVLTAAVVGEAPAGLTSTGDPRMSYLWSLLGLPSLCVPGLTGTSGLPVGVQLIGRSGDDARVLAAGAWLAARVPRPSPPDLDRLSAESRAGDGFGVSSGRGNPRPDGRGFRAQVNTG